MYNKKIEPVVDWSQIDIVMLDMDGTLLDKHFDDYFWEEHVPEVYAGVNGISYWDARDKLMAKYNERQGTLQWTDVDFWSDELGLDLVAMKEKMNHLINIHPYVIDFLRFCRKENKKIYLVTNAHRKTLAVKMAKTEIEKYFDAIICSEDIGFAKEQPVFWEKVAGTLGFKKNNCLFADDNEQVLASAEEYGLENLIFVAKSSSTKPVVYSKSYPSIIFFKELMPGGRV
jgi:5'-nucleotidase